MSRTGHYAAVRTALFAVVLLCSACMNEAVEPPLAADAPPEVLSARVSDGTLVIELTNPYGSAEMFWAYVDVRERGEMLGRIGLSAGNDEYGYVPGAQRARKDAGIQLPPNKTLHLEFPLPEELTGRTVLLTGQMGPTPIEYE